MTGLVDKHGRPLSSGQFQNKKVRPPALGERYGQWAADVVRPIWELPGGGTIAFDTSKLTLSDFRQMKGHYQINSSLSVLTFMMHQMEWHIEGPNKKVNEFVEQVIKDVWSRLVRAKSQALWAGFSPNALEWENDIEGRAIVLNKVKDLYPEDCTVHWKRISAPAAGANGAKNYFNIYDGIKQFGAAGHIPVENSYWYPLLMENGNYYGKRLLESAFQPWFFSTLMHLFANRYYERFGEPTPVGRAPYEDEIDVGGKPVRGNVLMGALLQQLRNRSAVVLPNEKSQFGDETTLDYDYQIEYLESQMRGADFERYMTRLDEEMSLALFTPILMMRTADVGSYNLGTQHAQVYLWMLNAIAGDWAHYINKFIIRPLIGYNANAKIASQTRIKFVRMGKVKAELLQAIVTELFQKDAVKYDVREIGEMAGLTLEEAEVTAADPAPDPAEEQVSPAQEGQKESDNVISLIKKRVADQATRCYRRGDFENLSMGYKRQLTAAFMRDGLSQAHKRAEDMYVAMDKKIDVLTQVGMNDYENADQFASVFSHMLDKAYEQAVA